MKAFRHWDDGLLWLRIVDGENEWDEPISGWTEVLNLSNGKLIYRHKDGREIES